jgi:hypothetical protein
VVPFAPLFPFLELMGLAVYFYALFSPPRVVGSRDAFLCSCSFSPSPWVLMFQFSPNLWVVYLFFFPCNTLFSFFWRCWDRWFLSIHIHGFFYFWAGGLSWWFGLLYSTRGILIPHSRSMIFQLSSEFYQRRRQNTEHNATTSPSSFTFVQVAI